ncbi:hypothetical protein Tco_0426393, partial [Tanacetum coccineum]
MTGGLLKGSPVDTIEATPSGIAGRTGGSTLGGEPIKNIETPSSGLLLPLRSKSKDIYRLSSR